MDNDIVKEIQLELEYLEKTVNDINGLIRITSNRNVTVYDTAASAMLLSQFYNGIENILKRILKARGIKLPIGEQSHIELFNMFTEQYRGYSDLPILFTNEIKEGFTIIRRFRHFVHHGYAFQLDWKRLSLGMKSIELLFNEFKNNL